MKRNKDKKSRKIQRKDIVGIMLAGFIIISLWLICIRHLVQGNFVGHENYYNQPIGTFMLLLVLLIATPIYIYMVLMTVKYRRVKLISTPRWMQTPPWKLPWT
jgi:heme/copper-type cytochrome/quinol oxidase subunit 2